MSLPGTIYNLVFKRSSTYAIALVLGALVVDATIDKTAEFIFNERNKGKLWHHIKDNYNKEAE